MLWHFLKLHLKFIMATTLGIGSIVFAFYTYTSNLKFREPFFIVHTVRAQIVNQERIKDAAIQVLRSDGNPVAIFSCTFLSMTV